MKRLQSDIDKIHEIEGLPPSTVPQPAYFTHRSFSTEKSTSDLQVNRPIAQREAFIFLFVVYISSGRRSSTHRPVAAPRRFKRKLSVYVCVPNPFNYLIVTLRMMLQMMKTWMRCFTAFASRCRMVRWSDAKTAYDFLFSIFMHWC